MTDSEKLDLLIQEITEVKRDVAETKSDVKGVKNKLSGLELHIENVTDKVTIQNPL